ALAVAGGFAERAAWKLWRAYAEAARGPRDRVVYGKEAYQVRILLERFFDVETIDRAYAREDTAIALIHRAIERLGGNYSDEPTFLEDGRLTRVELVSPRNLAVEAQHLLRTRSFDEVIAELDRQEARMPASPYPRTYRAEL